MVKRYKLKRILSVALTAFITFGVAAAAEQIISSDSSADVSSQTLTNSDYKEIARNNNVTMLLNTSTLDIRLKNNSDGHVWGLDIVDDDVNDTWKAFFDSGVTITCIDKNNRTTQASISNSKTTLKVNETTDGFSSDISFTDYGISMKLTTKLTDDGVSFSIPYSSLKETKTDKYKLQKIVLYPFLGASRLLVNGEIFIPDGCGALIDLSKKTLAKNAFTGRFYGEDIGTISTEEQKTSAPVQTLSMPVFGVTYNQKDALLFHVASGAEYAELNVYTNGMVTNYNFLYAGFIYREIFFQPFDNKGTGVNTIQADKNEFDIELKMSTIDGNNIGYSDMAVRYREELINSGILKKSNSDKPMLRLEFFMADHIKSMLGSSIIPMSTAGFCRDTLKNLKNSGIDGLTATITGYTSGGFTGSFPRHLGFEPETGNEAGYKELIKTAKSNDIPLFLSTDYVFAYKEAAGYSRSDISQTIAEQFITSGGKSGDRYYALSPSASSRLFQEDTPKFERLGTEGISIRSMGQTLFSSWFKNPFSRVNTIKTYQEVLSSNPFSLELSAPNQYLWQYVSQMADVPLTSSDYLITGEAVPFFQIVLKGHTNMFSPAINLNSPDRDSILTLIDYGVNPSYTVTENDPIALSKTEIDYIFTSQYSTWEEHIQSTYNEISQALIKVSGAEFAGRKKLGDKVFVCSYSNGISIIVNYSDNDFSFEGKTVPQKNYIIIQK